MYKKLRFLTTMLLLAVCCGTWAEGKFVKISSTSDLTDGNYLIVYEASTQTYVFNGALETLDAVSNFVNVVYKSQNDEISGSDFENSYVTITNTGTAYTIKSKSGYYIGHTGSKNTLNTSTTDAYENTITFNNTGNAVISCENYSLKFNSTNGQMRFRYFTSGQQSIFLYKYEETGGDTPSLTANDLALTGNTNLSFDLYNNASAQTISYTTSSTGAVTVSESEYITTTVNNGTITVTPVKVTPSAQTITVSQAADATYAAGSATFTVTITNSALDYATLPFAFDGSDVTNVAGLTSDGLGSYSNSPRLKFDNTDDYLTLKINETPGKLTFDIKGNGFSGGTFKVQTSADGTTYTDLETYTVLGSDIQSEEFNLASSVRFIKWIYTNKSSGNVALGNINLAKPSTDPFIEVAQTDVNVDYSFQDGTIGLTYANLDIASMEDFGIEFYDANQNVIPSGEEPDWIEVLVAADEYPNEGYVISYVVNENTDDSPRSAYFKVFALADNLVYSDLVTITQAQYVEPVTPTETNYVKVTSTTDITSGQYLIVYEGANVAFDGSLETLDAASNTIGITIENNEIAATTATEAAEFTIDVTAGTIKSASGYYIGQTSDANGMNTSTETAYTNTISIDGEGYAVILASGGAYLRYNSASNQERFRYYKSTSYTNQKAIQLYKKETPQTVTVSSAGYATYVAADNVYFPEDVTAYIVSDVTASSIKLTEVLAVAKDVPVVVKATAGTYDLEVVTADDCDDVTENKLLVSDGNVSDNILVLANKSNGVGFYTWAGGNLPAGKVYLVNPNSSREFFGFDEGVATSISTIDNGQLTMENAYNLQGQKVGSEYKGIVIVNGKKVMVK